MHIAPFRQTRMILRTEGSSQIWTPGEVEVDFGAGPVTVSRALQVLSLHDPNVAMPADGHIDWSQLEKLPNLITVNWSGTDRGVVAAAAARRLQYLYWSDTDGDIDLSVTAVIHVRLSGAGLRRVRLPVSLQRLQLNDPSLPELVVEAPDDGRGLDLHLFWRTANREQVRIPAGLNRITSAPMSTPTWPRAGSTRTANGDTSTNPAPSNLTRLPITPGKIKRTDLPRGSRPRSTAANRARYGACLAYVVGHVHGCADERALGQPPSTCGGVMQTGRLCQDAGVTTEPSGLPESLVADLELLRSMPDGFDRSMVLHRMTTCPREYRDALRRIRSGGPGRLRPVALETLAHVAGEAGLSAADIATIERLIAIKAPIDPPQGIDACWNRWICVPGGD